MSRAVEVHLRSFTYDGCREPVLRDTQFHLDYGQLTLLSGLSGCGKSTLLSLINGVIPRMTAGTLDGQVLVDGEDIAGRTMSQISRKVGCVLQNAESQIIHQSVEDEIAFGCENFGVDPADIDQRIGDSCARLGLERSWATRTLSGGQKQRLVTASTLAMGADILIFDEPLANLDQSGALELLELLRALARQGKAVLLVEHRLDVVLPYADVVWELREGSAHLVADKAAYLGRQVSVIRDTPADRLTGSAPALRVSRLTKRFGPRTVLDGLDLELMEAERLLLLGENGCGKSTLLSILARLQRADGGHVEQFLNPALGKRADRNWFRCVGVVYQNPNYQLFMPSVADELTFAAADRDYALELAGRFGLTPLLERHPHSLSEGQKRRVTLAAILAQKPRLLLLDEPTVGQDYAGLRQLVDVLNEIHREERNTMITITHDFRCAAALCDRAVWLERGNLFRQGGKDLAEAFFFREQPR